MDDDFDQNVVPALLATCISGLSTGIGGLLVVFFGKPSNTKLGHMLSFSAGVMIYISFMDLLTESIIRIGFLAGNFWFFMGMLSFAFIIWFFPEPEFHEHEHETKEAKKKSDNGKISKEKQEYLSNLGLKTAVGISLHNFPEGMAVFVSCLKGVAIGLPLTLAIAAHNIPEGMAVATPIYGATRSKSKAFWYATLSGACEPLGAVLFGVFLPRGFLTEYVVQCMLAAVAGIMVYMSIRELMPATLNYIKPGKAAISFIFGMFLIFLSIYYLHGMLPHAHTPLYPQGYEPTATSAFTDAAHATHDHSTCLHDH